MSFEELTQDEADRLIAVGKQYLGDKELYFPSHGEVLELPLVSIDKKDLFQLIIRSNRFDPEGFSMLLNVQKIHTLLRLDYHRDHHIDLPHRNPDGEFVSSKHIHRYCEGYGDKFAIYLPRDRFTSTIDADVTIDDFMSYCNIIRKPVFQRG